MTPHDLRGAAIIAALFGVVLVLAEVWARAWNGKPEHTRKLVHLGGSAIGVFLPLLVRAPLVAFALTAGLSLLFFVTSRGRLLRSVGGVQRSSRGSEYYPLAVFLAFILAEDDYWRYLASLLTLGIADAFAALVGSEYGRVRYRVQDESKSLEGSLVFLIVAYLAIQLPMLLLTNLPGPTIVLSSLLVAMVVTGFEAISLRGADNLFVPIVVCVILGKITTKPQSEIVFQVLSFIGLCAVIVAGARRFPELNAGATIAVLLFTYGLWSLGSPLWALPVLVALFAIAAARAGRKTPRHVGVQPVARACMPLVAILILSNTYAAHNFWYAPFLGAATALAVIGVVQAAGHKLSTVVMALFTAAAMILPPTYAVIHAPGESVATLFAFALLAGGAALALRKRFPAQSRLGNVIPAIAAIITAGAVAGAEYSGAVQSWVIQ
jgi:dolichol kinase